ncbi:hypothetical protein [Micromonospora tarensis]|uniref:Cupin n=1 Tax=Micromonospora tarensis TaxID=2806100 RepID=A0ABS1YLW7_9ACTN|nr:hypothetical protein [Micromonospora tarensis]MBM0278432.1 hypothetical protein [Micromonospora tarensis]
MDEATEFASYLLSSPEGRTFDEVLNGLRQVGVDRLVDPRRMHQHVLGFVQLRLATSANKELRIHHWPAGASFSEEPHTHLWDLTSYVLAGVITSTEYAVRPTSSGSAHRLFVVKPAHGGTVREPTGRQVRVSIDKQGSHDVGSSYLVPHGVFHTSAPSSASALTLITTSVPMVDYPLVAAPPQSGRSGHAPMNPPTSHELDDFRRALWQAVE